MIPVEGHKNLYRDEKSGAIINCDITGYNMYKKSKHKKQSQQSRINEMQKEIDELKISSKSISRETVLILGI